MGLAAWLDLDTRDLLAYLVAVFLGYGASTFLPTGAWIALAPIVFAYHLFLLWLLFRRHQHVGFPLPLMYALATHAACVSVVVAVAMSEVGHPQARFLRLGLAALASFEYSWLFKVDDRISSYEEDEAMTPIAIGSAEEYQEWLRYLADKAIHQKPASSLRAEFQKWRTLRSRQSKAAN